MSDKEHLIDNLIYYFPSWMLVFKKSPCYKELCNVFHEWLEADFEEKPVASMKLEHAHGIFLNLCFTDPEGVVAQDEYLLWKENQKKEIKYNQLYKLYLDEIKKDFV